DWVFGCDVCQEVCPWNRKAPATREPAFRPAEPLGDLDTLLVQDEATFRARFWRTALWRARRPGLARNVALALGNRRRRSALPALRRALADPDPVVRDAAGWALAQVEGAP